MVFLRTTLFLLIFFVMVYVGMENTHSIEFRFPMLLDKPIKQSAAMLYFAVFAVGVIGGTLITLGGGKSKGGSSSKSKKD